MSRPLHERLRELETEVAHLQVLPAAAVRARGRRRGRRQLATVLTAVAVVAIPAGVAATRSLERPHQSTTAAGPAATRAPAGPGVACVLALPDSPAEIRIRVIDAGAPAGVADATATQLTRRGYTVLTGTAGTTGHHAAGSAALRYGPRAIGAATVLRAVLRGDTTMVFSPDRADDSIDLTLGAAFTRLATTTETNQALAAGGEPSAPPECPSR